jgi:spore coat polysaccharide biosynthesis protein SpsF (cytidylyltransferase family)
MSSTRLPGKSAADVGGEPMLALLLRRLQGAHELERIVVATSTDDDDDVIDEVTRGLGMAVHRGPRDDVLARFAGAAADYDGPVVRVTADCPLIDAEVVDDVVRLFRQTADCAYASNIEPRTYPDGLDVEIVAPGILDQLAGEVDDPGDREHVTTAIRRDPGRFPSVSLVCDDRLGDLRWTVDTQDDLDLVRAVVARLGTRRHAAAMNEILGSIRADPSLADFHGRRG